MKYISFLITIVAFNGIFSFAQVTDVSQIPAFDKNGNPMLLGRCDTSALFMEPFNSWFSTGLVQYKTDSCYADSIKAMANRYSVQLFFGTWCGDSKREVPRMLKVLYQSGFKDTAIDLVAVSNHDTLYKQSPLHEERGLNIIRVPTLIVYQSGKEIGRIVETPVESIEKDIWKIMQRRNYLHKYMTN